MKATGVMKALNADEVADATRFDGTSPGTDEGDADGSPEGTLEG